MTSIDAVHDGGTLAGSRDFLGTADLRYFEHRGTLRYRPIGTQGQQPEEARGSTLFGRAPGPQSRQWAGAPSTGNTGSSMKPIGSANWRAGRRAAWRPFAPRVRPGPAAGFSLHPPS